MTFQLRAVHLYGRNGEIRSVRFRLDELNIITGASARGKSSVLDIISYCLGSSDFPIPAGVIRETTALYALELQLQSGVLIVARTPPEEGYATSARAHVSYYVEPAAQPPDIEQLVPNVDLTGLVQLLSREAGLDETPTDVGSGTRRAFAATIRHALFFVLQAQDEIASPDLLFHNQNEEWIPQAIRDTLPLFLGTVDPLFVYKSEVLRTRQRELRALERRLAEERSITAARGRGRALLEEAVDAGLLARGVESTAQSDVVLALVAAIDAEEDPRLELGLGDRQPALLDVRDEQRRNLEILQRRRRVLRRQLRSQDDFNGELGEQRARLATLNLLPTGDGTDATICPLCSSELSESVPSVAQVRAHLESVASSISSLSASIPQLQSLLAETEREIADINEQLADNQSAIEQATAGEALLEALREASLRRAAVRGRISLYLEAASRETEGAFIEERIAGLRSEIERLLQDLDPEAAAERLASALAIVSQAMTEVSSRLELEHAPSPARLDLRNLTVVVDTRVGSYRLNQIGSGENWLGYHIAVLVGLHGYFVDRDRPVPRFVVLDQPSQVYFPSDVDSPAPNITDDDRAGLARVFQELADFTQRSSGGFQVIVLDHADLEVDWFQQAVIERWRGDSGGLIPSSWYE